MPTVWPDCTNSSIASRAIRLYSAPLHSLEIVSQTCFFCTGIEHCVLLQSYLPRSLSCGASLLLREQQVRSVRLLTGWPAAAAGMTRTDMCACMQLLSKQTNKFTLDSNSSSMDKLQVNA
jgi:hypothetical protein